MERIKRTNGKIISVTGNNNENGQSMVINAQGNYVAPGFIDLHTHGGLTRFYE